LKFNKNHHKIEKWMTRGLLTSRSTKLTLEKIASSSQNQADINSYKTYRNIFNKLIKQSKKNYFNQALIANKNNLKKTWSILNDALNKKRKTRISPALRINGTLFSDPTLVADHFNHFFTTIAEEIASAIHPSNKPTPTPKNLANIPELDMHSNPITSDDILSALKSIQDKKTTDMHNLSSNLLKKTIHNLLAPLRHIFTLSLTSGNVPNKLKIAKIVPIFKSGDSFDMNNYRPISLLSIFSKILEKIVATRLTDFLSINNLLSPNQFGFRPSHSTSHPMTLLLNKISEAQNAKKHSLIIFCDLKKAFDTCNHRILLTKLHDLGIRNMELNWFSSYLSDRKQFVTIDEKNSKLLTISTGVPQGSILGPLLFLLYINDLPLCTELLAILFADDTALFASSENITELIEFVNAELIKICTYFRINKLSLHPAKTKYLLVTSNQQICNSDFSILLNNNNDDEPQQQHLIFPIDRVKNTDDIPAIKYLGVYFDPNLNFKHHIDYINKKLSRALYSLRSVRNILPEKSMISLYYSLFHCHLVYAIEIWSTASPSLIQPLIKKQKAAIRIISNKKYNDHTEPLFKNL
jgi:hypothetical protein